jgi:hypothetical protein
MVHGANAALETLQALLLLVISERMMTSRQDNSDPVIAWDEVIRLAQQAGHFRSATSVDLSSKSRWRDWVSTEASRR